jgi:hypothetical protein
LSSEKQERFRKRLADELPEQLAVAANRVEIRDARARPDELADELRTGRERRVRAGRLEDPLL